MALNVVTDSTADLPPEIIRDLGITVVPLNVHFGNDVYKDGVDLSPEEFYERLVSSDDLPKTSQPSVGDFVSVYEELGKDSDGILSVHLSAKLSGTHNSAVQAREAANAGCPVEVVDTGQASLGTGLVAIVVARAAREGLGMDEVADVARRAAQRCQFIVLLDTLEYLVKGGRIGKAQALLGTLLRIRPMVIVREGEVHELGKERTRAKGIARLERVAREFAPLEELGVMYSTTPEEARAMAQRLEDLLPDGRKPLVVRAGPVIGTHSGPGALGIALLRAETN